MRRFRRTTLIAVGCFSVLAGLALSRKVEFLPPDWVLVLWPLALLAKRRTRLALIVVILFGLGLGLWRGSVYMQKYAELKRLVGHSVDVELTATSDGVYSYGGQMEFTANKAVIKPSDKPVVGNFRVSGFGVRAVYRGDRLAVQGKIYPTRGANQARISYAKLSRLAAGRSWPADLARRFSAGMQNALPEPLSSFTMGLLVGQRVNMPAILTAELTAVGLVHIVAVSGYNLTILVRAVQRLKLKSKYQQLALSLGLIALFVSMTGFSASIVRAALVSGLGLLAWYYGRTFRPIVLLGFAAALTGLANPFYVWGDLSWYLSFLAFFGILIIAPVVRERLFSREPKFITSVVLETLSAELMTLPLIMLTFNQLSIIALFANVMIVPLVPFAMLLGAVAGFSGMLIPQLAGWLAWPAVVLTTYMLDIVHMLASIPSVLIHRSISATYMLSFYLFLLGAVAVMHRRSQLKNATITDRK